VEYGDIDVMPKRPVSIPPKKVHKVGEYYTTLGDKVIYVLKGSNLIAQDKAIYSFKDIIMAETF